MTPQSIHFIDKLPTNMPDNGGYQMFCCFHCHPERYFCYTVQPEPAASDPNYSHILQGDMKETVVNKSTTVFFKKCPFCKESQMKVHKLQRNNRLYKVGIKKHLHLPWQQNVCRSVSI